MFLTYFKLLLIFVILYTSFFSHCAESSFLYRDDDLFGLNNTESLSEIEYIYEDVKEFSEGLAAVMTNGLWGFIDTEGVCVIPFQYDNAFPFINGIACVQNKKMFGFINQKHEIVIPFREGQVKAFSEGLFVVAMNSGSVETDSPPANSSLMVLDVEGNITGQMKHKVLVVGGFKNGLLNLFSYKYGGSGCLDRFCNLVIPFRKYSEIIPMTGKEQFIVECGNKWGVVDSEDKIVIKPIYLSRAALNRQLDALKAKALEVAEAKSRAYGGEASYELAMMYLYGRGKSQCIRRAKSLLRTSFNNGYAQAGTTLASLLLKKSKIGSKDYHSGIQLLKTCEKYNDAYGMRLLANVYGTAGSPYYNMHLSNDYYHRACDLGDPVGQFKTAMMLWSDRAMKPKLSFHY